MSEVIRSCLDSMLDAHNQYMWAIIYHLGGDHEHAHKCWRTRDDMVALATAIRKIIRALDRKLAKEQARIDKIRSNIGQLMALLEEAGEELPRGGR